MREFTLEELIAIRDEAEKVFEVEYRKALPYAKSKESNPKKVLEIARKIARRKMNEWLSRNYGMRVETLEAKITAKQIDVPLTQLAV